MRDTSYTNQTKKESAKGRKAMLIIGIIILNISIFMAAFVFSFNLIINPIEKRDTQVQTLTEENKKLKSDSQLLQDQLEVVQSELDTYKDKYGSSSSSKSSSTSSSSSKSSSSSSKKSSDSEDSDDIEDSEESSGSSERTSSGSGSKEETRMNLDND